jgi:hypothetical protein
MLHICVGTIKNEGVLWWRWNEQEYLFQKSKYNSFYLHAIQGLGIGLECRNDVSNMKLERGVEVHCDIVRKSE